MFQSTARSQHFLPRTGSYATRGSATGRNLLNWDTAPENLTPAQQLEAQRLHVSWLEREIANPELTKAQRAEIGQRIESAKRHLAQLKKAAGKSDKGGELQPYIIQALKARLNKFQWQALIDDARARMREDNDQDNALPPRRSVAPGR